MARTERSHPICFVYRFNQNLTPSYSERKEYGESVSKGFINSSLIHMVSDIIRDPCMLPRTGVPRM